MVRTSCNYPSNHLNSNIHAYIIYIYILYHMFIRMYAYTLAENSTKIQWNIELEKHLQITKKTKRVLQFPHKSSYIHPETTKNQFRASKQGRLSPWVSFDPLVTRTLLNHRLRNGISQKPIFRIHKTGRFTYIKKYKKQLFISVNIPVPWIRDGIHPIYQSHGSVMVH